LGREGNAALEAPFMKSVWSARRLARKLARVAVASGAAVEPQLREAPGTPYGLGEAAASPVATLRLP
jgi:hypothetical protein